MSPAAEAFHYGCYPDRRFEAFSRRSIEDGLEETHGRHTEAFRDHHYATHHPVLTAVTIGSPLTTSRSSPGEGGWYSYATGAVAFLVGGRMLWYIRLG